MCGRGRGHSFDATSAASVRERVVSVGAKSGRPRSWASPLLAYCRRSRCPSVCGGRLMSQSWWLLPCGRNDRRGQFWNRTQLDMNDKGCNSTDVLELSPGVNVTHHIEMYATIKAWTSPNWSVNFIYFHSTTTRWHCHVIGVLLGRLDSSRYKVYIFASLYI